FCLMAEWQLPLQQVCGERTTATEKLHNTLAFFGKVKHERLQDFSLLRCGQRARSGMRVMKCCAGFHR
ncbi:MAG: hypothetical protein ACOH1I_10905, partial [Gallionellaceae bacterium]